MNQLANRVQVMVRSINPSREGPSTIEVNEAISEAYMHVGAIMPQALGEHVGSLVIPGGSATFQLPVVASGRDSGVEYAGQVMLRRQHDGRFMFRVSNEEMDRKTDGFGSIRLGVTATYFSLYEDASGVVQGRCFPRPKSAITCDVFSSTVLDDPRDAEDFDEVVAALPRQGQEAVVYRAAGMLAAARSPSSRTSLGIASQATQWILMGDRLAYKASARAHDMASVGRLIREQYQRGPTVPSMSGGSANEVGFTLTELGLMLGNVLIEAEE